MLNMQYTLYSIFLSLSTHFLSWWAFYSEWLHLHVRNTEGYWRIRNLYNLLVFFFKFIFVGKNLKKATKRLSLHKETSLHAPSRLFSTHLLQRVKWTVQAWSFFFSGLIFTTAQVMLINARIAVIFTSSSAVCIFVYIYMSFIYSQSSIVNVAPSVFVCL